MQEQAIQDQTSEVKDSQLLTSLLMDVRDHQNKQSFAALFEHFAPRVKSYVLKLGSNDTMAEEIAQQTLLQVWRKAHLFDESKAAASTWIFRIARNLRLDLIRKEKHYDYDDHDFSQMEDAGDTPDVSAEKSQQAKLVHAAMQVLSPEQREIIHLSFYEGLSHGEIAKQIDLPLGTVKSRIRLAFKRLKETMGEVA